MTTSELSPAARKSELRRRILAARDSAAASAEAAETAAAAVVERALGDNILAEILESGVLAGYWPIRSELDPRPLMRALASRGVDLALPVVTAGGLIFRRWREGDTLTSAGFGTLGPSLDSEELQPDILLVPLAACDRAGNRLGYGKGHYDGAIAKLIRNRIAAPPAVNRRPSESAVTDFSAKDSPDTRHQDAVIHDCHQKRPFLIGLGYDVQLVDAVPTEPHDQRLDAFVTPMQSIVIDNFRYSRDAGTLREG